MTSRAPTAPDPSWLVPGLIIVRSGNAASLQDFLTNRPFLQPADLGHFTAAALEQAVPPEDCLRVLVGQGARLLDAPVPKPLAKPVQSGRVGLLRLLAPAATREHLAQAVQAAVKQGNAFMLEECLALGAPADEPWDTEHRPVSHAAARNRLDAVTLLLNHGARPVSAAELCRHAATMHADTWRQLLTPEALQACGTGEPDDVLVRAVSLDRADLVGVLMEAGVPSDRVPVRLGGSLKTPSETEDVWGPYAAIPSQSWFSRWAQPSDDQAFRDIVDRDDAPRLKNWLERGLAVRHQSSGVRPSHLRAAVGAGAAACVGVLLEAGADPTEGVAASPWSAVRESLLVVAMRQCRHGFAPLWERSSPKHCHALLQHAVENGIVPWVRTLLDLGEPVQSANRPLIHHAVLWNRVDLLEPLLRAGDLVDTQTLNLCGWAGVETVETLLRHATELPVGTKQELLKAAVYDGRPDLIDALLAAGATPSGLNTLEARPEMTQWVDSYGRRCAELQEQRLEAALPSSGSRARPRSRL